MVTTFVFRVRNVPAALYKGLGGFATNGVNMTKLESYMEGGEFTATQFLADVDGHPEDPPLARALEELKFFSREVRILGVYPAHPVSQRIAAPVEREACSPSIQRPAFGAGNLRRDRRPATQMKIAVRTRRPAASQAL